MCSLPSQFSNTAGTSAKLATGVCVGSRRFVVPPAAVSFTAFVNSSSCELDSAKFRVVQKALRYSTRAMFL